MGYTRILLDTSAYLRLAKSIHPLLGKPFGKEQLALYLHKEIQKEINRSDRIRTKFSWIEQEEYKGERKKTITCTPIENEQIELDYDYIWDHQKEKGCNLSREDIYCIATAQILEIILVTDDVNMIRIAKDFNVKCIYTLELLKIMLDNRFIDEEKIEATVSFWNYIPDLPANFSSMYKRLFKKNPPI